MRIDRLIGKNFRNLAEIRLDLAPGVNILYGDNAQGKTNILEAFWMLTGGRSFRGAKDQELIRFGRDQAVLEACFYSQERDQKVRLVLGKEKSATLNEIPLKSVRELSGSLGAVVFSPEHLSVIRDGPEGRRRLIDATLCQIYPKYEKALSDYQRIVRHRNSLLRDIPRHAFLLDTLVVWDQHMARTGAGIARFRDRYVRRLEEKAKDVYAGISSGKEALSIRYQPGFPYPEEAEGIPEIADMLFEAIQNNREEDIRCGVSGVGPHRDNLEFLVEGISARAYGSQGQQRSCILAAKLAEVEILREFWGEMPLILLDDVMSELDGSRRDYLLAGLKDNQILITCCDPAYFRNLAGGRRIRVEAGAVCEENA